MTQEQFDALVLLLTEQFEYFVSFCFIGFCVVLLVLGISVGIRRF